MMNIWVYRAVRPAAAIMDRLRFPYKLACMAAIFLLPMLLVFGLLQNSLTKDMRFIADEQLGAEALVPLTDLVIAVQKHRVDSARVISGQASADELQATRAAVDAAAVQVETWLNGPGARLNLAPAFALLKKEWQQVEQPAAGVSADEDFAAHNVLIEHLLKFVDALADASNLSLDPVLATYALQDAITTHALPAMEALGQLRGWAATHLQSGQSLTAPMLGHLLVLDEKALDRFADLAPNVQRTFDQEPSSVAPLQAPLKNAAAAVDEMQALLKTQALDVDPVSLSGSDFFPMATKAITSLRSFEQALIPELQRQLALRAAEKRRHWQLSLVACAGAVAIAIYLFLGFMRSLAATLRGLRRATVQLTKKQYPDRIELFSEDEMQEIADELQKVSSALKEHDEIQREHLAHAAKLETALSSTEVGVMIVNDAGIIEYVNSASKRIMRDASAVMRQRMPNFDPDTLVGTNFDAFHQNPAHQRQILASLQERRTFQVQIGQRKLELLVTPVFGSRGERLGAAVEWYDRTMQLDMEHSVSTLVAAAVNGDFTQRIAADKLSPAFQQRVQAFNQLMSAVGEGLEELDAVLSAVANGDLTRRIERQAEGLFGRLNTNTNQTIERLAQIVGQIQVATDNVKTAAREIATGNNDLSARTEQQAASLEETASSMEELTSTVRQNAENALQASQLARGASDVAVKGGSVVGEVVDKMSAIQDASRKVADIVGVIDGIAFQTNILALNAAVEAARAGDQGRGFGVVASEVRSLAQRAAAAAKEIKTLISDSVERVDAGSQLVGIAGRTMEEIVASIKRVTDIMNEISAASTEQSAGIEQVNNAISHMDTATQQNAALVEQATAAARSLEEQSDTLSVSVSVFRVEESRQPYAAMSTISAAPAAPAPAVVATLRPTSAAGGSGDSAARRRPVARSSVKPLRSPVKTEGSAKTAAGKATAPAIDDDRQWQEF